MAYTTAQASGLGLPMSGASNYVSITDKRTAQPSVQTATAVPIFVQPTSTSGGLVTSPYQVALPKADVKQDIKTPVRADNPYRNPELKIAASTPGATWTEPQAKAFGISIGQTGGAPNASRDIGYPSVPIKQMAMTQAIGHAPGFTGNIPPSVLATYPNYQNVSYVRPTPQNQTRTDISVPDSRQSLKVEPRIDIRPNPIVSVTPSKIVTPTYQGGTVWTSSQAKSLGVNIGQTSGPANPKTEYYPGRNMVSQAQNLGLPPAFTGNVPPSVVANIPYRNVTSVPKSTVVQTKAGLPDVVGNGMRLGGGGLGRGLFSRGRF